MTYLAGQRVSTAATARVGADGTASVIVGVPLTYPWTLRRVIVQSDSAAQTTAHYYRGFPDPINLIEETVLGNGDSSTRELDMRPGEQLVVQWHGGTPGATCTVRVEGEWA